MSKDNQTLENVLKTRGPELTAYALGELSEMEMDALKKEFADNAEVLAYLREMEELGGLIAESVPQKATQTLTEDQKQKVLDARPKEKKGFFKWWEPKLFMPAFSAVAVAILCFVLIPRTKTPQGDFVVDTSDEAVFEDYYRFEDEGGEELDTIDDDSTEQDMESYKFEKPAPAAEIQQGGSKKVSAKDKSNAESQTKDPSKSGMFSTFSSGGAAQRVNKDYSSGGQLAGLADQATGTSSFVEGIGSKLKEASPGLGGSHRKEMRAKGYAPGRFGYGGDPTSTGNNYLDFEENVFKSIAVDALSTFSVDVDTASYAQCRTELIASTLPRAGMVRAEEFINYFKYDYPQPKDGRPFSVNVEVTNAPWNEKNQLVRIGLMGLKTPENKRLANNFVFLIDVSGSMTDRNKLPLVKESLTMLTRTLRAEDRVAIVTYSGSTEVVLASTAGSDKKKILAAIDSLNADGSTNGESGIKLAYDIAVANKISSGNNRVILATDGDFNVGETDENSLEEMVEKKAKKTGVFLTVLGYGMGNYQDSRMQKIANKGNGNNFYIDSMREARKVLVEQGVGTLNTIAKDVKIQVEFNPKHASSYRLIGYEKRKLNHEDFNDDQRDAGEIGEGHTVTALYEVVPAGVKGTGTVDPLKYQEPKTQTAGPADELLTVKLRYKKPKSDTSELIEVPVKNETTPFAKASSDTKFAAAVAGYTMVLRDSKFKGNFDLNKAQEVANDNLVVGGKKDPYRAEFVELIKKTRSLMGATKKSSENFGGKYKGKD